MCIYKQHVQEKKLEVHFVPVAEDEEKLRYGEADHYQRGRERVCSYNNCIEIISYGNSKV